MLVSLQILNECVGRLPRLKWLDISGDTESLFPRTRGVYLFKHKSGRIDYVGSATGRNGLRQRLHGQHLNPKYRKSVFRLKVEREMLDDPSGCSAGYIRRKYLLAFVPVPDHTCIVKAVEQLLILEYRPIFNAETFKG